MPAKITRLRRTARSLKPWSGRKSYARPRPGFTARGSATLPVCTPPSKSCRSAAACRRIIRSPENRLARCTTICSGFSVERKQEITYGPFSSTGAVRAVMEGIKVLYLGGWATSAKGSESEDPGADLANYALTASPRKGLRGCGPCCIKMRCNGPTGSE